MSEVWQERFEIYKNLIPKSERVRNKYLAKLSRRKQVEKLHSGRKIFTFDVETKDGLKRKELFCWALGFQSKGGKIKSISRIAKDNEDLDILFKKITNLKDKKHPSIVYVHNLGFESAFIENYCAKRNIEIFPIISGSSIISIYIKSLGIRFVDTFQFLLSSQDNAEKEYLDNIEKKFDFNTKTEYEYYSKIDCSDLFKKRYELWSNKDKKRVKAHNKNDVMALYLIMKKYRKDIFQIGKTDMITSISLASLSMQIYRCILPEELDNPFITIKWEKNEKTGKWKRPQYNYEEKRHLEQFVRQSYFGGRTEVFDMNEYENASYMDNVSDYPDVMFRYNFPTGIPYFIDSRFKRWNYQEFLLNVIAEKPRIEEIDTYNEELGNNLKFSKEEIHTIFGKKILREKYSFEGFIKAKIIPIQNSKYPILPQKLDNKLMFTNCERVGVYALPELRYAYERGYKIEPISGLIYEQSKNIFAKFVKPLFIRKSLHKGGIRKSSKITMNALYGKFGQAFEKDNTEIQYFNTENEMLDFMSEHEYLHDKMVSRYNTDLRKWQIEIRVKSIMVKPFMNISIASYVTSIARVKLIKKIHELEAQNINIFYCDSDSITLETKNLEKIVLSKELGGWDIEETFDRVKFLAPKSYFGIQNGKVFLKMKGLDKEAIDYIKEDYNLCGMMLKKDMAQIERELREPIQLAEKYMSYREIHRNGMIFGTKKRCKHYSYENYKRNFVNGYSNAWNDITIPEKFKVSVN